MFFLTKSFCAAAFVLDGYYMKTRILGFDISEPLDAVRRLVSMVQTKFQSKPLVHLFSIKHSRGSQQRYNPVPTNLVPTILVTTFGAHKSPKGRSSGPITVVLCAPLLCLNVIMVALCWKLTVFWPVERPKVGACDELKKLACNENSRHKIVVPRILVTTHQLYFMLFLQ